MNREMQHIDVLAGKIGFRVATTESECRVFYKKSTSVCAIIEHTKVMLGLPSSSYSQHLCLTPGAACARHTY